MKNIILLIIAIVFTIGCSAQTKVVNITDRDGTRNLEAYYKDADNNLDAFVGTWVHTDDNTSLKIVFIKELKYYYDNKYYEDILIGGYQYIENGVEKINTLSELDFISSDLWEHSINGNRILENHHMPPCEDCLPNEKRVRLSYFDVIQKLGGNIILRKITVDEKPALKILMTTATTTHLVGTPIKHMIIPNGYYTLIKQ